MTFFTITHVGSNTGTSTFEFLIKKQNFIQPHASRQIRSNYQEKLIYYSFHNASDYCSEGFHGNKFNFVQKIDYNSVN